MRSLLRTAIGAAGALALGLTVALTPVQSAVDTTPPVLTVPYKASFTVGHQVPPGWHPDCYPAGQPWTDWVNVDENFTWSATDNSGLPVRYDLFRADSASGGHDAFLDSAQTSFADPGTNADQSCGGGDWSAYYWELTARDAAGNTTTKQITGGQIEVTQDSNLNDGQGNAVVPVLAYSGRWRLANCTCWMAGGVHKTSTRNAAVTINVQLPFGWDPARAESNNRTHVGLVMHKGVKRGKFQVWVNGVLRATVDTYAATEQPRMLVYQTAVSGSSTIKIVNLATTGRPRIDLDAVLTN
jgi:hypothetical protein